MVNNLYQIRGLIKLYQNMEVNSDLKPRKKIYCDVCNTFISSGKVKSRNICLNFSQMFYTDMYATKDNCCLYHYTAKNARVFQSLLTSCNNLLQQVNIRMYSRGLRSLVDDKSVASCQQTCCKLMVQTCYQKACCKLFQQIVTSLQMTSCKKLDFESMKSWKFCKMCVE